MIVMGLPNQDRPTVSSAPGPESPTGFELEKGLRSDGVANNKTLQEMLGSLLSEERFDDFASDDFAGSH